MELLGWYLQCVCLRAGAVLPVPPITPLEIKPLPGNRARNKYFPSLLPYLRAAAAFAVCGGTVVYRSWWMHPLSQDKVNISPEEKW